MKYLHRNFDGISIKGWWQLWTKETGFPDFTDSRSINGNGLHSCHAVTEKVILQIEGMTWEAWPLVIKKALERLEGIEKANISFKKKRGDVFFDPDKVSEAGIVNKVNRIGFKAKVIDQ